MFGAPKEIRAKSVQVPKGATLTINVEITFESEDIHLNEEAPNRFQVKAPATVKATPAKDNISSPKFSVACAVGGGSGEVRISANLYYCDVAGACSMGNVDFIVPFTEGGSGNQSVTVSYMIEKFTD